jgi:hypothetical protein
METHSPSLPPLHSGDKKIRPSSYQNSLLQGMNNIDFLFMGDTHIRHNIVFFRSACRCAQLVLRLSPSSHRTALCSSGGRGACAATSVLPLPFRSPLSCGGAFWQGDKVIQFIDRKFPSSGIIRRC